MIILWLYNLNYLPAYTDKISTLSTTQIPRNIILYLHFQNVTMNSNTNELIIKWKHNENYRDNYSISPRSGIWVKIFYDSLVYFHAPLL